MNEADRDRRPPHDVTALLLAWRQGSQSAFEELIPIVYDELRRLAHRHLRGERRAHTLQTADLVHETYFRLVDSSRVQWQNRGHFFAVAAQCMRRILVDAARARQSLKRGGDQMRVDLDAALTLADAPDIDLVALDEALNALANFDARRGRAVELRFFAGLSVEETAEVLEVSPETVMRDWKVARAWLFSQLNPTAPAP
ncbi:MAG TPA: sigma-70 family RNA polymerase sigma factor [Vicinamibacterales bacterium]|jgi:RNA polymerase sigma factor (TIGR02999 family)|nr:sigma-70 family RNA polymerase sigma factor [Vicinamibacterales bacterium]